ncbi:hypothetical protein [Methylorubrum zatmanii]|uniref:Uncharacterized protein n=1 Tax=Methylorubrum zatmanii TaxID=29429 RepID=A0ABW1WVS9_9HYPH|nr:hypothetical protein [Methylorubrum zatmanii]
MDHNPRYRRESVRIQRTKRPESVGDVVESVLDLYPVAGLHRIMKIPTPLAEAVWTTFAKEKPGGLRPPGFSHAW